MPYRTDIPGQVSEYQLRAIECVASLVPEEGAVVEVGSLFGRSSWAWAQSVPRSAKVYCIDPWRGNEGIRNMEAQYGVTYGLEQFKAYTADCPNVIPSQGYSPQDFQDWDGEIDLYYEDAVHNDPIFSQNLDLWTSRLKRSGVACGDDHRPRFKDIVSGVSRQADAMGRTLITVDFFWCLLPSEGERAGADAVAAELRKLSAACEAEHRARGVGVNIGPLKPFTEASASTPYGLTVRLYSNGLDPWPAHEGAPSLGVRIFDPDGNLISLNRAPVGAPQLTYDIPHDVDLTFDFGGLAPGEYTVSYDMYDGSAWLHDGKSRRHPFRITE